MLLLLLLLWTTLNSVLQHPLLLHPPPSFQDCRLFWDAFRARENLAIVLSHKSFVRRAFERLRDHLPNLSAAGQAVIDRHDDSKLSFLEMVGYTDRWVWGNKDSKAWKDGLCPIEQSKPRYSKLCYSEHYYSKLCYIVNFAI